jgi:hypothetical protein
VVAGVPEPVVALVVFLVGVGLALAFLPPIAAVSVLERRTSTRYLSAEEVE